MTRIDSRQIKAKTAYLGFWKSHKPKHEKAMRIIIHILKEAGFDVNWDTQFCYYAGKRNPELPLYLHDWSRRTRADIVFQLDNRTLVSIEVMTWDIQRLSEYKKKKAEYRALRRLKK